jgi:hypothetical protein
MTPKLNLARRFRPSTRTWTTLGAWLRLDLFQHCEVSGSDTSAVAYRKQTIRADVRPLTEMSVRAHCFLPPLQVSHVVHFIATCHD